MSESFADLFEESLRTIEMAPGAIVTGTVVAITTPDSSPRA
jgi:small subunit ribosomal protein S1